MGWESNGKGGTPVFFTFNAYETIMVLHDLVDYEQAQTNSFTLWFRGEEGLE